MDQSQSQSERPPYPGSVYMETLHQLARAIIQSARDKVPQGSWLQRHLYLELCSLEQVIGKLNERLASAQQQHELADTPTDADINPPLQVPPIVLQHCDGTLKAVLADTVAAFSVTDGRLNTKLAWYRVAISSSTNSSTSVQDTVFRLSFIRPDPPADFLYQTRHLFLISSPGLCINLRQNRADGMIDPNTIRKWLSPFLQLRNHEPGEYYHERFKTQSIERTFHGLSYAAIEWPLYAEDFWAALESQILTLFVSSSNNYGFINWLLHFVRARWPKEFGWHASAKGPVIDLTDALCKGTITPLHVAAMFAMSSLCGRLLSLGADPNATGPLGTPLWCALVGPTILLNRMAGKAWRHTHNRFFARPSRATTVARLLDAGADYSIGIEATGDDNVSVSSMAFLVSHELQDETVLHRIIRARPVYDHALKHIIECIKPMTDKPGLRRHTSRLLTILMDECMRAEPSNESEALGEVLGDAIFRLKLELNPSSSDGRLPLPDDDLHKLIVGAIVSEDALALRRCVLDPRFDPNSSSPEPGRGETPMHLAVADDFFEAVDILIEAGADQRGLDASGRTPLMVVESVAMMEKLVLHHGAVTTDSDHKGRTIWHMAAATNDATLLEWLCNNDPLKEVNMNKTTNDGRTPLVEAFLSINELGGIPFNLESMKPKAANALLKHCREGLSLSSSDKPLPHLAVPWGDTGLLSALRDLGADFSELDDDGWTPLHHLNMSASSEFIEKLLELCPDVSWMSYAGLTPAETIFQNVRLLPSTDAFQRSSHPSCKRELLATAYNRLLDPGMLRQCDANGKGFWPRFCENVLIKKYNQGEGQNSLVMASIETALQCVLSKDIMLGYEKKTRTPGVLCLEKSDLTVPDTDAEANNGTAPLERFWNLDIFRRILIKIFRKSSKKMKRLFWTTASCQRLLVECCVDGELAILRYLCSRNPGIPIDDQRHLGVTVLEAAVDNVDKDSLEPLKSVLVCTPADHLIRNQMAILRTILEAHKKRSLGKELLQFFVDRGMRVNPEKDDGESMLAAAIKDGHVEVAEMLLGHGAKLDPGLNGFNALIATVQSNNPEVLSLIGCEARKMGSDTFPWGSLHVRSGLPPRNALHEAAEHATPEFMEKVLEEFPQLKEHINFVTEEGAPIHVAAKRGNADVAAVLAENGADLTLRDKDELQGYTPLHHACRHTSQGLLLLCIRHAPQTISVADNEGKTPLTLALELGNDLALSLFRRGGLA